MPLSNQAGHLRRAQDRYAVAKAAYHAANQAYLAALAALPELTAADYADEAKLRAHCEIEINLSGETGQRQALTALIEAEDALIAWTRATLEALPKYQARAAQLAGVWERGKRSVLLRDKLIDICMRLRPTGG